MLTQEEQTTLERWAWRPTLAQALAQPARVILVCAVGSSNTVVAARHKLTMQTVGKWRRCFVSNRLDGLLDEPRPGSPLRLSDTRLEGVLAMTLELEILRQRYARGELNKEEIDAKKKTRARGEAQASRE